MFYLKAMIECIEFHERELEFAETPEEVEARVERLFYFQRKIDEFVKE
jgi:hypothetical protein